MPAKKHLIFDQVATAAHLLLYDIAQGHKRVLMIAEDDVQLRNLEASLQSLGLTIPVLVLPAWDCIPYDRVSPRRDILAERAKALSQLAEFEGACILLTTVSGVVQKVPCPSALFKDQFISLSHYTVFGENIPRISDGEWIFAC